jgi:phospholipid/cholesterol/gamma-HCH transport system permease protein
MSSVATNLEANGRRRGPAAAIYDSVADLGAVVIRWIETVGDMTLFLLRTLSWLFSRLPRRGTLISAFYNIGVLSLPVVALTGTFIGMVLAVQSYSQFKAFGFETRLGALINLSMCRELGPVLAATMLAGRVGSAIAAEIGTMRVTEQIDALTSMGANPRVFFGATIAIVSCYRGFNCAPGAEGVGRAATAAFVLSFVIILILDLFLSIGLDKVHRLIWPEVVA